MYNFSKIGKNVRIYEPCAIIKPEVIILSSNIIISEFSYIAGGLGIGIGNHVHIATHTSISGGGYCVLEDFCGLSAGVRIITGSADILENGLTSPTVPREFQSVKRSFVYIKRHALLFTNVIIHPGVTIGEGTVVASGSIVTKDTEPWSIYMGIPARKIKKRQKYKVIEMEKKLSKILQFEKSDFSFLIKNFKKYCDNK